MANKFKRDQLVKCLPSGICAEVGVALGDFSEIILKNNNPKELYLIDSWENFDLGYEDGNMVSKEEHDRRYNLVVNKFKEYSTVKIIKDRSVSGLSSFPDKFFDWIYIDADHSYKGCFDDLVAAMPKIKKTGYLCGHDYLSAGFIRDGFGVNEAVHDFIEKFNLKLAFLTEDKEYKSYAICRSTEEVELLLKTIEQKRLR